MLRICTIHHQTNKFYETQKIYLEENTKNEDYIFFNGVYNTTINETNKSKSYDLSNVSDQHADRLNYLYSKVLENYNEDDILIFMDSDTFPISNNWVEYIKNKLNDYPIVAIQRTDNFSAPRGCIPEEHPHPCFFSTTVKFWKSNNLSFNNVETAGYSIGVWLKENNLDFYKIHRTNTVNIHPLMFGVYDDILYHHGAGNRPPYDGVDICLRKRLGHGTELDLFYPQILIFNQKLSNLVYEEIVNDFNFIKNYLIGVK
jgi:hypothetical protein